MKKVLFTATVDSHIELFHLPYLKYFKENGYEVHVATNGDDEIPYCDKKIKIPFNRSPYKIDNIKAIKQLKKIILEEKYDIIHTHTPMGSVVTRLAAKKARKKYHTRVIYTAHGFHFYKGAPKKYWMLFYPVEKYLSKYTDTLILINQEDYNLAKAKFKKCRDIEYVPGVGIDETKFNFKMTTKEKTELRKSLGLSNDDFVLIYPAELSVRKNQTFLINSISKLIKENNNIHLLLPGLDSLDNKLQTQVRNLNLEANIHFLGFRTDIPRLLKISDLAISTSRQEGLPVNIMEAMYIGLPIVATDCRGNRDLIENEVNGYIINQNDSVNLYNKIKLIYKDKKIRKLLSKGSQEKIKEYLLDEIIEEMKKIYVKKKKVLHVLASNIYSGAENVVCTIIENMSDEYDMAYCSPKGDIEQILQDKKIKYYGIEKLSIKNLKKVIKLYNPDIIHAHDFKASFYSSIFFRRVKVISHIHKNDPAMKKKSIKSLIYNSVSKRFTYVVGVSNSILDEYKYKSKIETRYITLYNCVDKDKIKELSNKFDIDKKYDYFYLGRLSEEKNPIQFIEIVNILDKKSSAIMIGDGPLFDECKSLIKKYNLNIDLVGFKKNPFPYIKNSKIGIMPSIYEGFGLAALECLLLNKPVFNSGVGGLKEIFKDNKDFICLNNSYVEKIRKYKKKKIEVDKKFYDKKMFKSTLNSIYD